MWKNCAPLSVLLVGLAGCGGPADFIAPLGASEAPGETAPEMTETASPAGSQAGCPAPGERRPTAFSRYWPYSYRAGEISNGRERVVLDWLDYDGAGEAVWYSYRYRPQRHPRDSGAWSPWIDVDDSRAVMSGLESGSAYGFQVRAAVDHPVPGGPPDCFFTRPADRTVRTLSSRSIE